MSEALQSGGPSKRVLPAIVFLVLIALAVRLFYFAFTQHIYGDAVQFALIANAIGSGRPLAEGDLSWFQFFCLWQVPFHWIISDQTWAAGLSSIIPGAALIVPVYLLGHRLGGQPVAVIASNFCALHPNLVNYSCNGYMESFYIFWFALAVWLVTLLFTKPTASVAIGAGVSLGICFATRNEFILFIIVTLAVVPLLRARWIRRWLAEPCEALLSIPARKLALMWAGIAIAAGFTVAVYSGAAFSITDTSGLFLKTGNLSRTHDIFKDREAAAREIYGNDESASDRGVVSATVSRIGKNLFVSLPDTLPRLLASPLYIFAFVPLFVWFGKRRLRLESIPLLMMLAFTPVLYTLLFIQPRYLQPTLPPLHVFSAVGIMLVASSKPSRALPMIIVTSLLVGLLAATTIWRGSKLQSQADVHHETADWIRENIPQEETLVGCGFGYISDTAFLTGNPTVPRIVTDDPTALAPFVRKQNAQWLILYEDFIREADIDIYDVLDEGIPGFEKVHATGASHIFRLASP